MISLIVLQLIRTLIIVHFYVGTNPGVFFFPKNMSEEEEQSLDNRGGKAAAIKNVLERQAETFSFHSEVRGGWVLGNLPAPLGPELARMIAGRQRNWGLSERGNRNDPLLGSLGFVCVCPPAKGRAF